jgi:hypothetical protein
MKAVTAYGLGRLTFAGAALLAPATTGRALAGPGGATADAQAFLRGIGGRELGIALGLLGAARSGWSTRPWILAGILADASDTAGIVAGWPAMESGKREAGVVMTVSAVAAGFVALGLSPSRKPLSG